MTFASMPKIELHLHHEAAAPPAFIKQLAAEKKIDISGIFDDAGNYAFRDFDHFIQVYDAATEALTTTATARASTAATAFLLRLVGDFVAFPDAARGHGDA
mgnify:CR=1 FL=1